jgi:hypothetical protein
MAMNAFTKRTRTVVLTCLLAPAIAVAATWSVQYSVHWRTRDTGGATFSSNATYRLGGTAGQHDPGLLTGGAYRLSGGFWVQRPQGCVRDPAWVCDGDVDGNGQVNPVDLGLLQSRFCAPAECTDEDLCRFDMDCNGAINPVDAGIVQALFGTCDDPRAVCD